MHVCSGRNARNMPKAIVGVKNRFPIFWLPKWESVFKVPCWHALSTCGLNLVCLPHVQELKLVCVSKCAARVTVGCWASFFSPLGGVDLLFRSESTSPKCYSWGLFRTLPPPPMALSSRSASLFHRCKEEARRACRAGKKQLVSFLLPL